MKNPTLLLSVVVLLSSCASSGTQDVVAQNNQPQQCIAQPTQIDNTNLNELNTPNSKQIDKWSSVGQQQIVSNYGQKKPRQSPETTTVEPNDFNAKIIVKNKVSPLEKNLNQPAIKYKQQQDTAKLILESKTTTPQKRKMLYASNYNRRIPNGKYRDKKIKLSLNSLLGKKVPFVIKKMGTPNISTQKNENYIWQYLSSADGLECTVDLTINDNSVLHIALLGPINKISQKKCFDNIIRFNMELTK